MKNSNLLTYLGNWNLITSLWLNRKNMDMSETRSKMMYTILDVKVFISCYHLSEGQ